MLSQWGAGVMTEFEYNLYAKDLPKDQFNAEWWKLVKQYQGIVPPTERGEEYCDAASGPKRTGNLSSAMLIAIPRDALSRRQ